MLRLQCSAHIVLAGLVDPEKEVSRLEKKRAALAGTADKLEKAAKVGGVHKTPIALWHCLEADEAFGI